MVEGMSDSRRAKQIWKCKHIEHRSVGIQKGITGVPLKVEHLTYAVT